LLTDLRKYTASVKFMSLQTTRRRHENIHALFDFTAKTYEPLQLLSRNPVWT